MSNISNAMRAEVLAHALPHIKEYAGKVVVVKYGGSAMIGEIMQNEVMKDITLLSTVGVKVVLVHGGGPEISELLAKTGKKSEFVGGLRVTDKETADAAQMALAGKVGKNLASIIGRQGGRAVSLCGLDGNIIRARQIDERLGFVGEVESVDTALIDDLLSLGYIPVIAPLGADEKGQVYNINADTAAAGIAGALRAEGLIQMTDVGGILTSRDDPDSVISEINVSEVPLLIHNGVISGGMIPKAECCVEAIRRGVRKVFIIDGRVPHSIITELLTDEGMGTMLH